VTSAVSVGGLRYESKCYSTHRQRRVCSCTRRHMSPMRYRGKKGTMQGGKGTRGEGEGEGGGERPESGPGSEGSYPSGHENGTILRHVIV
jgi:hypothetical protein